MSPNKIAPEYWRAFYPTPDGSACFCYDFFGAECSATCASSILDYEVVKTFGNAKVAVSCNSTTGNVVLGGGQQPAFTPSHEYWRSFNVYNETSFTCYDFFGIICYAVCGKLA